MRKLLIFVASSTEAKSIDIIIRKILEENDVEVKHWSEIFTHGEFGLESLLNVSNQVDGAIIIATPDDKTWYRGSQNLSPRDNIIFESGLFIKSLGRKRTGIIIVKNLEGLLPRMPTDLMGLNMIMFDISKKADSEIKISNWITNVKMQTAVNNKIENPFNFLKENYTKIPDSWKDEIVNYILSPFKERALDALRGEFTLSVGQYYSSVLSDLKNAGKNTIIRAISLLPAQIWKKDDLQIEYEEYNFVAAKNGAEIKRIFICSFEREQEISKIINRQINNGIKVKILSPKIFAEFNRLEDSIIISRENKIKSYLTNQYLGISSRLKGCRLNVNYDIGEELIAAFERAWSLAKIPTKGLKKKKIKLNYPPGQDLEVYFLNAPVISCEEAARAKNIRLENELKTLILSTSTGFIAVHLPGDGVLSLRAIKNVLDTKEACLADPEDLSQLGLTAGTVCAIQYPVWSMRHLISKRLLTLDFVSTNNGTKTGYYKFDPVLLLDAKNYIVGEFEKSLDPFMDY